MIAKPSDSTARDALRAMVRERRRRTETEQRSEFKPELFQRIKDGQLIPIVSNAVYLDMVFASWLKKFEGSGPDDTNPMGWNAEDIIADLWAQDVNFPLPEQHWLPRVALYVRVTRQNNALAAKMEYLNYLKDSFLSLAESEGVAAPEDIDDLSEDLQLNSFADMVERLGYPLLDDPEANPIEHLAKLNLPIYITTSHFDFLERAIIANGRTPRTQICFWAGEPNKYDDPLDRTDHAFIPTVENPLVYHIFGSEMYLDSMVLNEDDYLDFLNRIAANKGERNPYIPTYLTESIAKSSLLLLGYRLRDWEFRVMFRGLIGASGLRDFNLAIQLDLRRDSGRASADKIKEYLKEYFGNTFTVSWLAPATFMSELWKEWQRWLR